MARRSLFGSFFMRVYLGLVAVSLLFTLVAAIGWDYAPHHERGRFHQMTSVAGELAQRLLPDGAGNAERAQQELAHWHERASIDLTLFDAQGRVIASAGRAAPGFDQLRSQSLFRTPSGRGVLAPLPDGRSLFLRPATRTARGGFMRGWVGFFFTLSLATLLVSLVAYPVARRISARIERLEKGVQALGEGDLKARVRIEGNDEVAALAASFNRSAQRVEQLLDAQRSLLANASHELRSPLTRIRMALELLPKESPPDLRTELSRNIHELDQLVDEILLASRLQADANTVQGVSEVVDLAALCAEECARVGASFSLEPQGEAAAIQGDPKLLRRLLRNLLENAQRYGNDLPIEVNLAVHDASDAAPDASVAQAPVVRLTVADRGPGVPAEDRSRIFEPFYRSKNASEQRGGVGLGLSIAQQIAARHATRIVCRDRAGGGSAFVVEFTRRQ